jgi:broad specificity phosphatase PhoE
MDVEKIWNEEEWTRMARDMIRALHNFPKDSNIILLLRHSHRNEPNDSEKIYKLRLTSLGHEIAKKLGEELPISRPIRLFHSIVWRCQETAEDILEGFNRKSGKGEIKGNLKVLYNIGASPNFFDSLFKEEEPFDPTRFLHLWAVGYFSPNEIKPFQDYSKEAAEIIWSMLDNAPKNAIDIHISHDLFIIALRYGWFGLPPPTQWIPFLGGFAFTIKDNMLHVFDNNQFFEMKAPYWWKNLEK